jgi:hypothetical protein
LHRVLLTIDRDRFMISGAAEATELDDSDLVHR